VERGNVKIHPLSPQRISAHTNRQEAEDNSGLAKRVNLVRSRESSQYDAVVRRPATRSTTSSTAAAALPDPEEPRYTAFYSQSWSKIRSMGCRYILGVPNRIASIGFRGQQDPSVDSFLF
jgi:hypothetical protein